MSQTKSNDLLLEYETEEDEAYVEYEIVSYPSDNTLKLQHSLHEQRILEIPEFQRSYVWTQKQASLLIESFLLGLPVPPIFLYVNDEHKFEIIDGQQRILSIVRFLDGYFGEPDARGKRTVFSLVGLSEKSPFRGRTIKDLDPRDKCRFEGSVLRAINVRQIHPSQNPTSIYHIFERLNTGGTRLSPQDLRNVVFRGPIVEKLRALNEEKSWRLIFGSDDVDKRQRDVEIILRLLSLYRNQNNYEKPMKELLNLAMKRHRNFNSELCKSFEEDFLRVVSQIHCASIPNERQPRMFKPKGPLNVNILEAVFITVMENQAIGTRELQQRYQLLPKNEQFGVTISGATTDTVLLKERLRIAERILSGRNR